MANTKIVSFSIRPEQHDLLKKEKTVKKANSVSEVIRGIVDDHLSGSNVSLESDLKDQVDEVSLSKGVSSNEVVNDLLKRYLAPDEKGRSVVKGESLPVVLKIPSELKGNRKELAEWLQARAQFILNKLA